MKYYTIEYRHSPLRFFTMGDDHAHAARVCKQEIERLLESEITDGDWLTVCELEGRADGQVCHLQDVILHWSDKLKNFTKSEA